MNQFLAHLPDGTAVGPYRGTMAALGLSVSTNAEAITLKQPLTPWLVDVDHVTYVFFRNQLVAVECAPAATVTDGEKRILRPLQETYGSLESTRLPAPTFFAATPEHGVMKEPAVYAIDTEWSGIRVLCEITYNVLDRDVPFVDLPHTTVVRSVVYYAKDLPGAPAPAPARASR